MTAICILANHKKTLKISITDYEGFLNNQIKTIRE